jgi:tetratricopeptide (TPR) repeat protein
MLSSEEEWRRAIVDREIDLPLKLTPEEYELINTQGHLLLSGSAGTGKTTVGLYRLCKSLENLQSGKRLYTAYNRILVANSEEQFVHLANQDNIQTESIFQFKTIKDLCLDILTTVGKSYRLEDEVTYQIFEQLYCRRPDRDKPYPSTFIWDEIRSIIKGAHLDTDSYSLSKVKYEELGEKRSSIVPKRDRHKVYKVSEWYQAYLKNEGRFDEIDLARDALQVIKKGKHDRYQLIVCDEVQDFTELQLKLLVSLVEPTGTLFFAGDLHQMISPSGFRWGDLKKNFFGKQNQTTEKTLQFNFRSVGSLVNLANQLLKLRSRLLGESVKESEKKNSNYGETARLITAPLEHLKTSFGQLNPDDVILVRNDENKQILRKEFNSSFVFTIEEAKGLEFGTVVLVDFFKHRQLLWNKVLDTTRKLMDINIPELRLELNLLYVAVTRARRILNIWETQRSSIWEQKELINFVNSIDSKSVRKDQIEPTTKMWVDRGVYYRDAGFYEQAIECFKKADDERLKLDVEVKILLQERNYSQAAELLVEIQDWEQAAQVFEKAKIWNRASDCWEKAGNMINKDRCLNEGKSKAKTKSIDQVHFEVKTKSVDQKHIDNTKEFNKNEIDNIDSLTSLAIDNLLEENYKEAIEICNKVIKINPHHLDSYKVLGAARGYLGDIAGAISSFTKCINISPKDSFGYQNRGTAHFLSGNFLSAIYDFTNSIKLNPRNSDVYFQRGQCHFNLDKIRESIEDFSTAMSINPEIIDRFGNSASVKFYLGDYKGSIIEYDKLIKLSPKSSDLYYYRGLSKFRLELNKDAIEDFNLAINLNPELSGAYYDRGITMLRIGDNSRALRDLNKSISLNPEHTNSYASRGGIFLEQGSYTNAIKDFNKVIALNYHDPKVYNNRANAKLRLGEYSGALSDYNQAIELDCKCADAYANRAVVMLLSGKYEKALFDCNQAIRISPNFAMAHINRSEAKRKLGDFEGALKDEEMAWRLGANEEQLFEL